MKVAILQPSYLPWLGYFEQLAHADLFLFLDDVQYTRSDWRNRNRIKTLTGPAWLTVPVRRTGLQKRIVDTYIDYSSPWPERHLNVLAEEYRRAPHYEEVAALLRRHLFGRPERLRDLCTGLVHALATYMGLPCRTMYTSELGVRADDPTERLIRLCARVGATSLYEGRAGTDYLDLRRFRSAGIDVVFQDYQHPHYPQFHPPFTSHLSVVDLLFHVGRASGPVVLSGHGVLSSARCAPA
jgi:hypothetical protein